MANIDLLDLTQTLKCFIWEHRQKFETKHNNMFSFSLSDIQRYYGYLIMIQNKYPNLYTKNKANAENTLKSLKHMKTDGGVMTKKQINLLNESASISNEVLFLTESFFLFSKILLDKIARFVEFYFGQSRGLSLDSHDDLVKRFSKYSSLKGLKVSKSYIRISKSLKEEVSDFRDQHIAHHKNPRTVRITMLGKPKSASLLMSQIYPKDTEKQIQSVETEELLDLINEYLLEVINLIVKNEHQTALTTLPAHKTGNKYDLPPF